MRRPICSRAHAREHNYIRYIFYNNKVEDDPKVILNFVIIKDISYIIMFARMYENISAFSNLLFKISPYNKN